MPKKTTRNPLQDRAKATVDTILTATAHILNKDNLDALNTNKIAEKAGVGIGSLYQYFSNKNKIIEALAERIIASKLSLIEKELSKIGSDSLETRVHSMIATLLESRESQSKLEIIVENQISKLGLHSLIRKMDEKLIEIIRQYLEPQKSELKSKDLDDSILILIQAVRGAVVLTHHTYPGRFSSKKLARILTDMAMAGIQAEN